MVLNHSANELSRVNVRDPTATLVNNGTFTLGNRFSITDILDLSATGDIRQFGTLTLGANVYLRSDSNVVLVDPSNDFQGWVALSVYAATMVDANQLTLGGETSEVTVLELSAAGDISQSGALVLQGNVKLSSAADVVLDEDGNDFGSSLSISAFSATLLNRGAITIGGAISVQASLTIAAGWQYHPDGAGGAGWQCTAAQFGSSRA